MKIDTATVGLLHIMTSGNKHHCCNFCISKYANQCIRTLMMTSAGFLLVVSSFPEMARKDIGDKCSSPSLTLDYQLPTGIIAYVCNLTALTILLRHQMNLEPIPGSSQRIRRDWRFCCFCGVETFPDDHRGPQRRLCIRLATSQRPSSSLDDAITQMVKYHPWLLHVPFPLLACITILLGER